MKKTLLSLPAALLCATMALSFSACSDDKDDDDKKSGFKWCGVCYSNGIQCDASSWGCSQTNETYTENYCTSLAKGKLFASESECKAFTPTPPTYNVYCQTDASSIVGEGCFGVESESDCETPYKGTIVESCPEN